MRKTKHVLIIFFFNMFLIGIPGCLPLFAANPASANVNLSDSFSKISLGENTEILEDPQGLLTIAEVTKEPSAKRFRQNSSVNISLGMTRSTYWLRFRLPGVSSLSETPILLCDSATLKEVTLYIPFKDRDRIYYRGMSGGWNMEGTKQDAGFLLPAFAISRSIDDAQYLYMRVKTPYTMSFRMQLHDRPSFQHQSWFLTMLVFVCLGVLSAMILYNTSLSFFLKDRHYLIYVLYMFFQILYQISLTGAGRILNANAGAWLLNTLVQSASIMTFLAALFAREFNFTKQNAPIHYRLLNAIMAAAGLNALFAWGFPFYANQIIHILGLVLVIVVLSAGITVALKGYKPAFYFIIAWSTIFIGAAVFVLRGLGWLPANAITFYALLIAAALESILLSIALAHRIRILQGERDLLQTEKITLSREATIDELSGLYNRHYFNSLLPRQIEKSHFTEQPLTLLVIDIDYLKRYNDTYGHQEGDCLISAAGQSILSSIRTNDWACRYGGEEFVVIMPGIDSNDGKVAAMRISNNFKALRFKPRADLELQWTISIGIAQITPDETAAYLFKRADQALYEAKTNGRDRIETA
ncbi:MAG: sensor domain-containing diguanylate cyclase [Syntrophales bacterium]|nr:sensor domain-containing diguanylate cyclase [Syntrophales bacterium]